MEAIREIVNSVLMFDCSFFELRPAVARSLTGGARHRADLKTLRGTKIGQLELGIHT